jgi:hypothetical protein
MTRYTVVWLQDAQAQLSRTWLEAPDRQLVTNAVSAIDAELRTQPHSKGSPLSEGLRKLRVPPLEVAFAVREADRIVEVSSAKAVR